MAVVSRLMSSVAVATAVMASSASATTLFVNNPSFESPGVETAVNTTTTDNSIDFWQTGNNASPTGAHEGVYDPSLTTAGYSAPNGDQVAYSYNSVGSPTSKPFIAQDLGLVTTGVTYALDVLVGQRVDITLTAFFLKIGYSTSPTTFVPFGTFIGSGASLPTQGTFKFETVTGTAPATPVGAHLIITMGSALGEADFDQVVAFDNQNPVPLPAALPLFAGGLGVIGLLARRRKRKNAAALAAA